MTYFKIEALHIMSWLWFLLFAENNVEEHISKMHEEIWPNECKVCNSFKEKELLNTHTGRLDAKTVPFYDREQITNFLNYHKKITPISRDKEVEKENIQIRKRTIFQQEKRKYSN